MSILGKVLEKFVKKVVVNYFEENDIFYNLQFGFRTGRSTIDALYYLVDIIMKNGNNGLYTTVAFLDLTKAFNCLYHKTLLDELEHYGLGGIVLECFDSYLSHRKQFTKFNEYSSLIDKVRSGVPQGPFWDLYSTLSI